MRGFPVTLRCVQQLALLAVIGLTTSCDRTTEPEFTNSLPVTVRIRDIEVVQTTSAFTVAIGNPGLEPIVADGCPIMQELRGSGWVTLKANFQCRPGAFLERLPGQWTWDVALVNPGFDLRVYRVRFNIWDSRGVLLPLEMRTSDAFLVTR